METLLRISRTIDALNERIGRLSLWLVLIMVIVGIWKVLSRYVGYAIGQNLSSNVLIETQWYIFDIFSCWVRPIRVAYGLHSATPQVYVPPIRAIG